MANAYTLQTMIDRVAFALRNDYARSEETLRAEIKRTLNDVQNEIWRTYNLADFVADATFDTVLDQAEYDLPFDAGSIIDGTVKFISDPKYPLTFLPQQAWDSKAGDLHFQQSSEPCFYTLRGRAFYDGSSWTSQRIFKLLPAPDRVYTIGYSYIVKPVQILDADESSQMDPHWQEEFIDVLIDGAASRFPQYLDQDQLALKTSRYEAGKRAISARSQGILGATYVKEKVAPMGRRGFGPHTSTAIWSGPSE